MRIGRQLTCRAKHGILLFVYLLLLAGLLDIFAGCGGLSAGLHEAEVADTKWAVEFWKPAADAFQMNNPNTMVLNEECNKLLEAVLKKKNVDLPVKGDVEMMCGGNYSILIGTVSI